MRIRVWLGENYDPHGARARVLRTCLAAACEEKGVAYVPLDSWLGRYFEEQKSSDAKRVVMASPLAGTFKTLIHYLDDPKKLAERQSGRPILRITELGAKLATRWVLFADPTFDNYYDALRKIDSVLRTSRYRHSWLLEIYFLLYLGSKNDMTFLGEGVRSRIQDFTHSPWIRKKCEAMRWNARLLEELPDCISGVDAMSALIGLTDLARRTWGDRLERGAVSEEAVKKALKTYRQDLAKRLQYVDYRGIAGMEREPHAASFMIDELYVMPWLRAEQNANSHFKRERQITQALDNVYLGDKERLELTEELPSISAMRWSRNAEDSEKDICISDALANCRHAIVRGGPGSGKSTLLQYLARTYALGGETVTQRLGLSEDLIPIHFSAAAYADANRRRQREQPELSVRDFIAAQFSNCPNTLQAAVARTLSEGRAIVLIDGVDEAPTYDERARLVQEIDEFLVAYGTNRIIVTSRPLGYVRLGGDIPHFELLSFSRPQRDTFIHCWERAYDAARSPVVVVDAETDAIASALIYELDEDVAVADLVTNPLMLAIAAALHREHGCLPQGRVEFYDRIIRTLMDTWNHWRSHLPRSVRRGKILKPRQLVAVWAAVAEWSHRSRPTGILYREELKREVVRVLKQKKLDEGRPDDTTDCYFDAASNRAGLVEERGYGIFAFWHPTFVCVR